jgi:hypothetical protein
MRRRRATGAVSSPASSRRPSRRTTRTSRRRRVARLCWALRTTRSSRSRIRRCCMAMATTRRRLQTQPSAPHKAARAAMRSAARSIASNAWRRGGRCRSRRNAGAQSDVRERKRRMARARRREERAKCSWTTTTSTRRRRSCGPKSAVSRASVWGADLRVLTRASCCAQDIPSFPPRSSMHKPTMCQTTYVPLRALPLAYCITQLTAHCVLLPTGAGDARARRLGRHGCGAAAAGALL